MGLVAKGVEEHFTVIDRVTESRRAHTHPGMAHFAGTGPARKTCRECEHWTGCGFGDGYYSGNGKHGGVIKPRSCAKYRSLMHGEVGPAVPFDALPCRHFVQNPNPPPVVEKRDD